MAETKSGYKLIHLKFKRAKAATLQFAFYFQKWLERLAECDNITLDSHARPTASDYYAYLNGGALTGFIRPSNTYYPCMFGTSKAGGSSYLHTGLSIQIAPWASGMSYYDYIQTEARIIVDEDNNLVYGSSIKFPSKSLHDNNGFLFTNGGIMSTADNAIYSMGANPTQIASCGFQSSDLTNGINTQMNAADMQVFRSKAFLTYTDGSVIDIRDHVEYIYSLAKSVRDTNIANAVYQNVFENITVDGQKYMHLGGYIWIPFDEEETEEIEVIAS